MIHSEGTCIYNPDGKCTAISSHKIFNTSDEGVTYEWDVRGEDVIEYTPKYGQTIYVLTRSSKDSIFSLTCRITYADGSVDTKSGTYVHKRTLKLNEELCIADLIEIESGSCKYEIYKKCKATSKYKVIVNFPNDININDIKYKWVVQNCTIEDGQNTDELTVSTYSNKHKRFHILCYVYTDNYETNISGWFTHTRYVDRDGNACAFFRVLCPDTNMHTAYGPIDVDYFRTSGLIHGICLPPDKGSNFHPIEPEDEQDPIDSDVDPTEKVCYNFNCSNGSGDFVNYRQKDGNFTTSDIWTACPKARKG